MNQEYVIINKTELLKRIEELKNYTYATQNIYLEGKNEGELQALSNLLSQSTPLIPENINKILKNDRNVEGCS